MGAVAVAVPAAAFLHENEHIRMLSDNVTSLIVRADASAEHPVRIVAAEDEVNRRRMRWFSAEERQWLKTTDKQGFSAIAADLSERRSGVRELLYEGRSESGRLPGFRQARRRASAADSGKGHPGRRRRHGKLCPGTHRPSDRFHGCRSRLHRFVDRDRVRFHVPVFHQTHLQDGRCRETGLLRGLFGPNRVGIQG